MIENSESKKGENAVLPLRNMMVDYDFQQRLASALQAGLPDSGIATRPVVSISNLPWEGRADLQTTPPRTLVIRPRYALDQTMSAMYVTRQATLEDREARRGGVKRRIAFTRPYTFRTTRCMGHAWSGSQSGLPFTDSKGPDATLITWLFLKDNQR